MNNILREPILDRMSQDYKSDICSLNQSALRIQRFWLKRRDEKYSTETTLSFDDNSAEDQGSSSTDDCQMNNFGCQYHHLDCQPSSDSISINSLSSIMARPAPVKKS